MRGARSSHRHLDGETGIIPAYAGSTVIGIIASFNHWDHPRVCGEHLFSPLTNHAHPGSSPRMRGARAGDRAHGRETGIIPAYAGSTPGRKTSAGRRRDHPRVCGEHISVTPKTSALMGSSPRMRGAQVVKLKDSIKDGIIPAYAGSTSSTAGAAAAARDHPRVCGEHLLDGFCGESR